MAITTYGELKTAIGQWMMGANTTSNFSPEDVVTLAQDYLNRNLRTRDMVTRTDLTISSGEYTLPTDFLMVRQLVEKASTRRKLSYIAPEEAEEVYGDRPSGLGIHYTIFGSAIRVFPTPSNDVELTYYARLGAFANDSATDWLLTKSPGTYLQTGMLMAAQFIHDDAKFQQQAAIVDRMIRALNGESGMQEFANVSLHIEGVTP